MTIAGPDSHLACNTRKERGSGACDVRTSCRYREVEARVLAAVSRSMLHPAVIEEAVREYIRLSAARRSEARLMRARLESDLAEVKRRTERLLDLAAAGVLGGATLKERFDGLEARRAELERQLGAPAAAEVVAFHPAVAKRYRQLIDTLQANLEGDDTLERRSAREALRTLVRSVRVTPREARGQFEVDIEGDLAALMRLGGGCEISEESGCGDRI
jgi:hypothetical protein